MRYAFRAFRSDAKRKFVINFCSHGLFLTKIYHWKKYDRTFQRFQEIFSRKDEHILILIGQVFCHLVTLRWLTNNKAWEWLGQATLLFGTEVLVYLEDIWKLRPNGKWLLLGWSSQPLAKYLSLFFIMGCYILVAIHVLTNPSWRLVIFSSRAFILAEIVARLLVEEVDAQKRKNIHAIKKKNFQ